MNINRILALNIPDIHPAYGGVRGKTMSSRSLGYAWPVIKDAGVHTIIDLRNDGMKTIKKAVRALLLFMLILCNIGAYAQKKMEYNIDLLQKV